MVLPSMITSVFSMLIAALLAREYWLIVCSSNLESLEFFTPTTQSSAYARALMGCCPGAAIPDSVEFKMRMSGSRLKLYRIGLRGSP